MTETKVQLGAETAGAASPVWAAGIIALAAGIVLAAGLASDVVKGDEAYHWMFAEAWARGGVLERPVYNPIYPSGEAGYYFTTEALCPFLVSLLWRVTGVSQAAAQALQAAFYVLLLAAVYGLGRDLLGPRGAIVALLAAVAVPMVGAFSVLLFTDVPAAALAAVAALLLVRKRFLAAGVVMGLAYLTKRNTAFLAPAFVVWAFWTEGPAWRRLGHAVAFVVPAALVTLPDWFWRKAHLPALYEPVSVPYILTRLGTFFSKQALVAQGGGGDATRAQWLWAWLGSSGGASRLNNPSDLLQYIGALLPAFLVLYLVRRAWDRRDARLWIAIGVYLVIFLLMFTLDTEIRYAMPAIPLVAVVAARGLRGWYEKPWVLALVGLAAFGQLGAMAWYVKAQRSLAPGQRAVFAYLRDEMPPDTRILYPGEVMVAQTKRRAVWSQLKNPETDTIYITGFLRETDPERIQAILDFNGVDYICVDERRVYKDRGEVVGFGYPRSFVKRLPTLPFLERVEGDWPGIELWHVKGKSAGDDAPAPAENTPAARPAE
ncbi:MAG TPA: glycosyltransferase family 39 protein [Phycisphaerae bacterium]|nr:glycosyltransferase family 39 protein [Phycisphaerae bacterium]